MVPGTVLATMLGANFSNLDPYVSTNLQLLPDIHQVGRSYYTVRYRTWVGPASDGCTMRTLFFRACSYKARVYVNGVELGNITGTCVVVELACFLTT